ALTEQVSRLQSSLIELKDLGEELGRTEQEVLLDEDRLIQVNDRLSLLYALQQKHHVPDGAALIALREELRMKLDAQSSNEAEIRRLHDEGETFRTEMMKLAGQLSEARKAAIPGVEKAVNDVLHAVGMPHGQLRVALKPLATDAMKESGGDEIQFLFTANKGQAPQP